VKSSYQDLRDLSADRGGSQAALNGAMLNALEVPAPSKDIQMKIVTRINAALTELDAVESSSVAALQDIRWLPSRILAQAFESQGDEHD
jgi:type I restriction enzyme S subunit